MPPKCSSNGKALSAQPSPVQEHFSTEELQRDQQRAGERAKRLDTKRRTQFFEDQFRYKAGDSSGRENALNNSPVVADLRTNVIVKDEYSLVTDLSNTLSGRYRRSESSIMVNLEHSACLILGGSFEPGYLLTITACPSLLQPATNKRNVALLQKYLTDLLGVSADRGIIKFVAIPDECLAISGRTVRSEIERLQGKEPREEPTDKPTLANRMSRNLSNRRKSRKSMTLKPQPSGIDRITPPLPSPVPSRTPSSPEPPKTGYSNGDVRGPKPNDSSMKTNSYADSAIGPTDLGRNPSSVSNQAGAGAHHHALPKFKPPPIPKDRAMVEDKAVRNRKSLRDIFKRKQ
ncbi:Tautomerase/MIF [Eremomyces bilateralis CBS 781.70]|uniref:L-dopachrome isomerase n=1 Tax=Eremomyces bilateralis CBS 781.70 TaxID=1392243 RepID=A0A6G1G064_9PEZI|nr:Tautomerase/MIF [Eremomyces bilateralis CBS 781.70]KAF1811444.1 Tautomerase/MIF [Eremomyces bilateralis CBS 781.70]